MEFYNQMECIKQLSVVVGEEHQQRQKAKRNLIVGEEHQQWRIWFKTSSTFI
jgi:hypothetical protein